MSHFEGSGAGDTGFAFALFGILMSCVRGWKFEALDLCVEVGRSTLVRMDSYWGLGCGCGMGWRWEAGDGEEVVGLG